MASFKNGVNRVRLHEISVDIAEQYTVKGRHGMQPQNRVLISS